MERMAYSQWNVFLISKVNCYSSKMFPVRRKKSSKTKSADALEKGETSPVQPAPQPGGLAAQMAASGQPGGLAAQMAAGGIIKIAAGVADMQPKIINRQMSTASFDMNSRQYEQVNVTPYLLISKL